MIHTYVSTPPVESKRYCTDLTLCSGMVTRGQRVEHWAIGKSFVWPCSDPVGHLQ